MGRPGGNPDIKNIRKQGPKTPEGKLRVMMSSQHLRNKLIVSNGSKVLGMVRQCDNCPLRTKIIKRRINDKLTTITHYSTCPGYKKGKKECMFNIRNYIKKMGVFFDIIEKLNGVELQKAFIMQSLMDADAAREMETLEKGYPGLLTDKHMERAMRYTADVNKLMIGEKVEIDVKGEVKVEKDYSDDQLRRIADIMLEKAEKGKTEKVIDVEGKVDER